MNSIWTRRQWLTHQTAGLVLLAPRPWRLATGASLAPAFEDAPSPRLADRAARVAAQTQRLESGPWQALAQRAVDAARTAGARYAEARLTRLVVHEYGHGSFEVDDEMVGVGVRALVGGYWGFSASAVVTPDEVVRLAQDAVGQAKANANGPPWTVELGQYPVATGNWSTPVRIDPFTITIEEKCDFTQYWKACAAAGGVGLVLGGIYPRDWFAFSREERVLATSEGTLVTQTLYESGGEINAIGGTGPLKGLGIPGQGSAMQVVHGITTVGAGWERLLDANIPDQFLSGQIRQEIAQQAAIPHKPFHIGKYTLVCDGATMAALVEATLGMATQLDRALGYEANASGTSWIDDPLSMVGNTQVAASHVTLTANRSAPQALATVKWDDEGMAPTATPFPLVKDGVLVDFQTTREQAAWLAPYYQQHQQPVRSHACAAGQSAHVLPLQQLPNLSLEPSAAAIGLADLVADVPDGILVEAGTVESMDFQGRTGVLTGRLREIKNGRLGPILIGGAVLFESQALWKGLTAVGGAASQGEIGWTPNRFEKVLVDNPRVNLLYKGQPSQLTSHSVRAVAATIPNQPLIDPNRKG